METKESLMHKINQSSKVITERIVNGNIPNDEYKSYLRALQSLGQYYGEILYVTDQQWLIDVVTTKYEKLAGIFQV